MERPVGNELDRGGEAGERSARDPAPVEPSGALPRREDPRLVVPELREVRRQRDPQRLRVADVQRSRRVRSAQPFLAGDGVEVVTLRLDGNRPGRLRAVDEDRQACLLLDLLDGEQVPGQPGDVGQREQPGPLPHLVEDRLQRLLGRPVADPRDAHARARCLERAEQAEVLAVRRDHLVLRPEVEAGQDDVAALGRRAGQRDVRRVDVDDAGERGPGLVAQREHLLDIGLPAAAAVEVPLLPGGHRLERRAREWAHRPGIQERQALEDGELRAGLLEVHVSDLSTGAWSESSMPFRRRRSSGQTCSGPASSPRTRTWSIPGPSPVKPR